MTRIQGFIVKYIGTQFYTDSLKIDFIGEDKVNIKDRNGDSMTFTSNIFGDIMDADTKKILAISNVPHDLDKMGDLLPTEWTDLDTK